MDSKYENVRVEYVQVDVDNGGGFFTAPAIEWQPSQESYTKGMQQLLEAAIATDGGENYRLVSVASMPVCKSSGTVPIVFISAVNLTGFYQRP
jgi:hypothetical protein